MSPPLVGIVVLTYNSELYIEKCLDNVLKNTYSNILCVVVDNDSTDETVNIVHKKFSKVKLMINKTNKGFAAGNNVGIKYLLKIINVSYVIILNPDTIANRNLISELVNFMENTPNAGIAGPIITYANNSSKIWFAGGYLNKIFGYTRHLYMNKTVNHYKTSTRHYSSSVARSRNSSLRRLADRTISLYSKTDFITGACMIVKRDLFEKIGLLPEEYFIYYEDVDFCQKAIKEGYTCRLLPKPLVRHYISTSTGNPGSNVLTPFRAYYYARNPFIYIKKNVDGLRKITNYIGQFSIRLPYYGAQILIKGNLKSFIAYLKGINEGINYKLEIDRN